MDTHKPTHPATTLPVAPAASDEAEVAVGPVSPQTGPEEGATAPDPNQIFRTDHLRSNLKSRTIRGGMIAVVSQGIKFVLNIASTMTLARLLTPAEFGLVAMVTPITGFIALFKDLGLSMATVQREDITHEQVSTLFWINVAVSTFLALITMAISPLVGLYYHDTRTTWITLAVACTFVFGGLAAQHGALLNRNMRFGVMAALDIANITAGLITAIITASLGWSYWSLVAMSFAYGITSVIGVWIMSPWRPGPPTRGSGVRSMLKFGGGMTLATLVQYICTQIDKILLGRFYYPAGHELMDAADLQAARTQNLGVYTRAFSLFVAPIVQVSNPLMNLMTPVFCRLAKERERLSNVAVQVMELASAIVLPAAILGFVSADDIIAVLLGSNPQWAAAAPVVRAFSPFTLYLPIGAVVNTLFITTGRSDVLMKWEGYWFVIFLSAALIGVHWGALGMAYGLSSAGLFCAPFHVYVAHRVMGLRLPQVGRVALANCLSAAVCMVGVYLVRKMYLPPHATLRLALDVAVVGILHLMVLLVFGTVGRVKALFKRSTA